MSVQWLVPSPSKSNISRIPLPLTTSNISKMSNISGTSSTSTKSSVSRTSSSSSSSSNILKSTSASRLKQKSLTHTGYERSYDGSETNTFICAYTDACVKYKTRPTRDVKVNSKNNSVEMWGDNMKTENWQAAMEALSADIGTHYLRVENRRRHNGNPLKSYETISSVTRTPNTVAASSTQSVVHLIATSVNDVLHNSHALVCLELKNVLFDELALETLISGVETNQTLQHLSLAYCRIGDKACLSLCRVLRYKPNVRSLNLSGCSLSPAAAHGGLVEMIKKQQIRRHEECWAHSLRYRTADPDIMQGLRRLTLNDNTGLGDDGVADLFEALKDDLYIKAVDVQNCGLTDRGGQQALSTLMINDTLVVLDVRKNDSVSATVLEAIMIRLCKNSAGKTETNEWKWTKLWRPKDAGAPV